MVLWDLSMEHVPRELVLWMESRDEARRLQWRQRCLKPSSHLGRIVFSQPSSIVGPQPFVSFVSRSWLAMGGRVSSTTGAIEVRTSLVSQIRITYLWPVWGPSLRYLLLWCFCRLCRLCWFYSFCCFCGELRGVLDGRSQRCPESRNKGWR